MKLSQLVHAIRAACDLSGDHEMWVFGSQAVLGNFPNAELIPDLSMSIEVDMTPKNKLEKVDEIDALLGDGSIFHQTYGFYIDGVPINDAVRYPDGWQKRCVTIETTGRDSKRKYAYCVEIHDLIVGKLVRFAQKDMDFIRAAVKYGLADPNRIMERIKILNDPRVTKDEKEKMTVWCRSAIQNFNRPADEMIGPLYGTVIDGNPKYHTPQNQKSTALNAELLQKGLNAVNAGLVQIMGHDGFKEVLVYPHLLAWYHGGSRSSEAFSCQR